MTEKIGLDKGFGVISGLNGPRKAANTKPGHDRTPADRVDFSTILQEVGKAREGREAAGVERSLKLAELKQQVAEGTYRPDLDKVAASLVKFIGAGD